MRENDPIGSNRTLLPPDGRAANLLALDDNLTELAATDARKSRLVELRSLGRAGSPA